ncbi:unnamed protein product [Oikopleura dioica]|uniref:F-box domain-containing protein n=1 Tax=Oikopleura dioica TaxID=34765 RepID=E4WY59_OIKDI|nr:unnamed protein product [Oikopleura dioica]
MSFRLPKILYTEQKQLPPPLKDYVTLNVTQDEIVIHHIRICAASLRHPQMAGSMNKTHKASMSDFLNYGDLENKIVDWFGQPTLDIVKERAKGNIDFLNRLPEEAKIAILTRLPLEELPKMGLLNKEFAELCKSNELWEKMCEQNGITIDENVRSLGLQIGFKKIFFSNKVEIQRHIRKMKKQSTFITA